jgi:3-methylcrotonyl-CoA carboxylase alpha subunit
MGIGTVGIYSDVDRFSQHALNMDQSFLVGPPPAAESYLKFKHLIEVADYAKCEAVHPGYGFLSENAEFVEFLNSKKIKFIGPPAEAIRKMGSKSESKKIMTSARVPCLSGYHGDEQDPQHLLEESKKIGFPVMLKASLGGGGKGMRIVRTEEEFFD